MPEIKFEAPYGDDSQHVFDPAQHHGYHWIVASGVFNGATTTTIMDRCNAALESGATADAVRQHDHGAWKLIRDYDQDEEMVHSWRQYVRALEKYEAARKEERDRNKIIVDMGGPYPLMHALGAIGMYEVTEKTWPEAFVRLRLFQDLQDFPLLRDGDKQPVEITPDIVKTHIGCVPRGQNMTRDEWWLSMMRGRARSFEFAVETAPGVDYEFPRPDEDDDATV